MAEIRRSEVTDDKGNKYYLRNDTASTLDPSNVALNNGGDLSEASVNFAVATARKALTPKARFKALMGDIAKWLTDLGTAAFKNVANNDTTTAEGFVADARIVKQHGDEIDELISDLDGCSFERREDGAYITYTLPGGADPVVKKLGSYDVVDVDFTLDCPNIATAYITINESIDAGIIIAYGGWQSGVSWISTATISAGKIETLLNARAWGGSTAIYVGLIKDAISKSVITLSGNDLVNGGADWFHLKVVKFV